MTEQWRPIDGYPNYEVSNQGRVQILSVKGKPCKRIVNSQANNVGYLSVVLKAGTNDWKRVYIHRLVALAFIPNPDNKPTIDHINRIRTDNKASNLRWFSYEEQGLNTNITVGPSGERCIQITPSGKYRVSISRKGFKGSSPTVDTLEEAIIWRDTHQPHSTPLPSPDTNTLIETVQSLP